MTQYNVIYADPPWKFKTHSDKGLGRSAEAWYDCLSIDEICAIPVENLAAPDCVLLMWVTDPFLRESFRVIDAWGFTFKTVGFYWTKRDWNIIFAQDMGPAKPPITQQTRQEVWDSLGNEADLGPRQERKWKSNSNRTKPLHDFSGLF